MIVVRHYSDSDAAQVMALHERRGLAYVLPDLDADTMLVRTVIEEDGVITNAVFLRKTAEVYWMFDPDKSKRERIGRLMVLHKELNDIARRAGFEDIHAWVPPQFASDKRFDSMMRNRFLWIRPEWVCYNRKVE